MPRNYEERLVVVWLRDERTFGTLKTQGAYASLIQYTSGGIDCEEWVENDDFIVYENIIIKIEDDEAEDESNDL